MSSWLARTTAHPDARRLSLRPKRTRVEAIPISARLASLGIQVLQPGSHIRRRAVTAARPARSRAANHGVDFTITPTLSCATRRFFWRSLKVCGVAQNSRWVLMLRSASFCLLPPPPVMIVRSAVFGDEMAELVQAGVSQGRAEQPGRVQEAARCARAGLRVDRAADAHVLVSPHEHRLACVLAEQIANPELGHSSRARVSVSESKSRLRSPR